MNLYLLRHGTAEANARSDAARALTARGRVRVEQVAEALARMDVRPDVVYTSPAVRARQTAEIVAARLGLEGVLREADALMTGALPSHVAQWLATLGPSGDVMLVGHEPTLSMLAGYLCVDVEGAGSTSGRVGLNLHLRKAGLIHLRAPERGTWQSFGAGACELEAVYPPRALIADGSDDD